MNDELVLYTHPMSRGRIVRWVLEEANATYRTELLEYGTTMKAPAYLAINPMGKVPALRHGKTVVTESAAICTYLADLFPAAGLAPALADPLRGAYYRWLFFSAGPLDSAMTNHALGLTIPKEKEMMSGYGNLPQVLNTLESILSQGDYLLGQQFSAADIHLGSSIGFMLQLSLIENRPVLEAYWERISQRPAAQRANQLDDALAAQSARV